MKAWDSIKKRWTKIKSFLSEGKHRFQTFMDSTYADRRKTLKVLFWFVFTVLFCLQAAIILLNNSFYTNFSDDILQYYTIITDFINQIKDGTLSLYNLNNYLGASYFSDSYYIPLDIFTFTTFGLSYVMPIELAYSVTEHIKILAGVMTFVYYLSLKGMKNRTLFWMGLVYFVAGGSVSFMAFPVFLSLIFYLPLGLLVIHWFFKKKAWVVPLYVAAVVFYDFYIAYMVLAFVSVMFIVEYMKYEKMNLWAFLKSGMSFLALLLLGVAMSLVILYPSVLFILEDTYRPEGHFNGWDVSVFGMTLTLFPVEIYIRMLAKLFTEQRPIGFYGFANDYSLEHVSLFITVTGLVFMNYVYFMKDRVANVYKVLIPVGLVFMFFPIFSQVFTATLDKPYTRWINFIPLVMTLILAHVFDEHGFEKTDKIKTFLIALVLSALNLYIILYYHFRLEGNEHFSSRDMLEFDYYLLMASFVFLLLIILFLFIKRHGWIKYIFLAECVVAMAYVYSGPFSVHDKIDTFENMRDIDGFLREALGDEEEFYRVYVDIDRFDAEDTNFNRMTFCPTNTRIFHSWTDAETSLLTELIFNRTEYQTKESLNQFGIYLNVFLGYRYVMVDADYDYAFPDDLFTLVYADHDYMLYEIDDVTSFNVYETYASLDAYDAFTRSAPMFQKQAYLFNRAIIDEDEIDVTFDLEKDETSLYGSTQSIDPYTSIDLYHIENKTSPTDDTVKEYYVMDTDDLNIGFDVGALYMRSRWIGSSRYGEIFMENADGDTRMCQITEDEAHQIKCEFWEEPSAIYFEAESIKHLTKKIDVRMERAIDRKAYLVYDLSGEGLPVDFGALYFTLTNNPDLERVFFVDENGRETESFKSFYYFDEKPVKAYVLKTGDMYDYSNLFHMDFKYTYDNLSMYRDALNTSSLIENAHLEIDGRFIDLRYERTSDTTRDQLVVIPIPYSEEWQNEDGYATMSVNGGFLGVLVPEDIRHADIQMTFLPKGLKDGLLGSAVAWFVYGGIFGIMWIKRRKERKGA